MQLKFPLKMEDLNYEMFTLVLICFFFLKKHYKPERACEKDNGGHHLPWLDSKFRAT